MPVEIGPVIGIKGEAQYRAQINSIITQTKTLHSEMRAMESSWNKDTSAKQKAADKSKLLTSAIQKQKQIVEQNNRMLAESSAKYGENDSRTQKWRQAVANATTELNRLEAELRSLPNSIQAVGMDISAMGQKIADAGKKISSVGQTMTRKVTAPIAAVGVATVKMASDFETSMAKVSTIADDSVVSYDDMRAAILKLSDDTGVAATDIAENVYQAISAGQDTANAVKFVEATTKTAKAGFADTGETLDVLTTILNAYGIKSEDVTKISDKLIQTQNLGKTTVAQLAQNMGAVIPTAAAYGVSIDQLTSGYVALTKNGIQTASATTYLNSMIDEIGKTGSKSAKVLKDKTGKSLKDLMKEGYSLTDVLDIIDEGAQDAGVSISDMFTNKNARKAANSLTQNVDDFNGALVAMGESAGTTDSALQKVSGTTAAQFKKALNEVKNTGIDLGQAIITTAAPAVKKIADEIKKGLAWWRNLDDSQKSAIIKFAGIAAAIGPVLSIGGKLVTLVGNTVKGVGNMITGIGGLIAKLTASAAASTADAGAKTAEAAATGAAATAQEGLNAAMLANPIGLVVAAVAGLTAGLAVMAHKVYNSEDSYEGLARSVEKADKALKNTEKETKANISEVETLSSTINTLNSKESLSTEEKMRLAGAVKKLNDIMPDLNLKIDENTGKVIGNTDAIQKNIDAALQQYKIEKNREELAELTAKYYENQEKLAEAGKRVLDVQQQLSEHAAGTNAYDILNQQLAEARDSFDRIQAATLGEKERYKELTGEIEESESTLSTMQGNLDATGESLDGMGESAEAAGDGITEMSDEVQTAMEEMRSSIENSINSSISLFDKFDGGTKISADKMSANLDSQIAGITNWQSNLSKLMEMGGENVQGFVQMLAEQGPQSANAVQALVDGGAEKLQEIASKWDQSQTIAALGNAEGQAMAQRLGLVDAAALTGMNAVSQTVRDGWNMTKTEAQTGAAGAAQSAADTLRSGKAGLDSAAYNSTSGVGSQMAAGETSGAGEVQAAAQMVANYADVAPYANAMAAQMTLVGSYITASFAQGITSKGSSVGKSMKSLINQIKSSRGAAQKAGREIGIQVGKGVQSSVGSVKGATAAVNTTIRTGVTQVRAQAGAARAAGAIISSSIGAGIRSNNGVVRSAVSQILAAVKTLMTQTRSQVPAARSAGLAVSNAVGAGIKSGSAGVKSGVTAIVNAVKSLPSQVRNQSSAARSAGSALGQSVASGLSGASGSARSAGQTVANAAKGPLEAMRWKGRDWGQHLGQNFANGISDKRGAAIAAARATANAVAAILQHSTPKEGPLRDDDVWGAHLAENFARGIVAEIPAVRAAALSMARAAEVAVTPAYDPSIVSGRGALQSAITQSIDLSAAGMDPDALYSAVRSGASDAGIKLYIGERELGRVLRDMGVVFAA